VISSESVCQVARSWVDVRSFHTRLFGVAYVSCGDLHDVSEKGTASVQNILCQSWEKCYRVPHNDSTSLRGPKRESCAGVSMACICIFIPSGMLYLVDLPKITDFVRNKMSPTSRSINVIRA
jgi:hypothetical protein